uniref:Uncharacterized protein n=1 Tax=Rhizophora mucronata TaxID=61149 RepID=A0A2P2R4F8_RHIMU
MRFLFSSLGPLFLG